LTFPPLWPLQDRSLAFVAFANEERSVFLSPPQTPDFLQACWNEPTSRGPGWPGSQAGLFMAPRIRKFRVIAA
jgi:hypothetical protein